MNFFHRHHHQDAPTPLAPPTPPSDPTPSTPQIWSTRYSLPLSSLLPLSLAFQTDNTSPDLILSILAPFYATNPNWDTVTPYAINHAWRLMNTDQHWSIWRAERRVRAYVEAHGDERLQEDGRRQMTELLAAGKEEWEIFTGVSQPRTEEERKSEEGGGKEMEEERAREGKVGGPANAPDGNSTDVRHSETMVAQPGTVPAIVPTTATPEAKKEEEEEGGGLVSKMAKMAFTGVMKHQKKKKQNEKVEKYREEEAERAEVREEEVGGEGGNEEGEEEEEEGSSSSSEEQDDEGDEDEDEEEEEDTEDE
ncbi:MAG: hypothetical protein Q9187_008209 [Circinaria calcarea]